MGKNFKKVDRFKFREYIPIQLIGQDNPLTFRFRLLSHKELAEFDDKEHIVMLDTNEIINRTSEVEYEIALKCLLDWKNLIVEGNDLKAQVVKGQLENLNELETIGIYDELRELGKYIRYISIDPELEDTLQNLLNN